MRRHGNGARGFSLVEVLVAVVLAAGPVLVVVGMGQAQAREAHALQESERMSALLHDAVQLLVAQPGPRLARLARPEGKRELDRLVSELLEGDAGATARPWEVRCSLDRAVTGVEGLARLEVTARADTGAEVRVSRLLRVHGHHAN